MLAVLTALSKSAVVVEQKSLDSCYHFFGGQVTTVDCSILHNCGTKKIALLLFLQARISIFCLIEDSFIVFLHCNFNIVYSQHETFHFLLFKKHSLESDFIQAPSSSILMYASFKFCFMKAIKFYFNPNFTFHNSLTILQRTSLGHRQNSVPDTFVCITFLPTVN